MSLPEMKIPNLARLIPLKTEATLIVGSGQMAFKLSCLLQLYVLASFCSKTNLRPFQTNMPRKVVSKSKLGVSSESEKLCRYALPAYARLIVGWWIVTMISSLSCGSVLSEITSTSVPPSPKLPTTPILVCSPSTHLKTIRTSSVKDHETMQSGFDDRKWYAIIKRTVERKHKNTNKAQIGQSARKWILVQFRAKDKNFNKRV